MGDPDVNTELTSILEEWSASRGTGQDPIPTLTRLCDIVEKETELYLKMDPDPFDDRHPARANPSSALGPLLKTVFRNDEFMDRLVNFYISQRDNKKLNEVSCSKAFRKYSAMPQSLRIKSI